ncbi:MAG TPA: tRNA uridine-5-carboxymethylaminomethyl(34) synthesis enzyme MnmG, partial [Aequorivita sp.]|nr:tRNA uridine-5-carboxymethylaminomethyl(34) synthesis enzyme MnmG [Aequorivita sp.]
KETSVSPEEINEIFLARDSATVNQSDKMFKFFSRPEVTMADMKTITSVENYIAENDLDSEMIEQAEIQVKYSGYIEKEKNNA